MASERMGHNDKDETMVRESEIDASQCANAMIEIMIRTMDSQTYTLRVDKTVPVPELKERVASVTGVVPGQQRLICRGRELQDDQLLSAYHVEDGHTLHLVTRQPIAPSSESSISNAAADPALSAGDSQGREQSRVVVRSFNIDQIVSSLLRSLGGSNTGIARTTDAAGLPRGRVSRSSDPHTARDSSGRQYITPIAADQTSVPLTSSQPAVIPDSLTTLSEFLNHLRQEFAANGSNTDNLQGSTTGESRIPRLSHLAEVLQSTRQLLSGEVENCLSNLLRQLENHVNVTDPSTRRLCQSNMTRSGSLLENVGISLLELGRATRMLRLGQTPNDAVVSAGPAVFLSPTVRNPLSVRIPTGSRMPSSGANLREGSTTEQTAGQAIPSQPSNITVSAFLIVRTRPQPSGEHQPVVGSSRQPQSLSTSRREGDSSSAPDDEDLSELRPSSQVVANPSATEMNEAVASAEVEPRPGTDEGNSGRQASSSEGDAVVSAGPAGRNPLPYHSSGLGASIGGLQAGTGQSLASAPRNVEIRTSTRSWMFSRSVNPIREQTAGQVSSGERSSTGLDSVPQPQSPSTSRREGDSSSAPDDEDLSELPNIVDQRLGSSSPREDVQVGTPESQVANVEVEATSGTDEDEATDNSGRQAFSSEMQEEEDAEREDSSRRRHGQVLPRESKRHKREC